ncbi:hypothetical protein GF420_13445 [candidate division GN15 bacterium]|nr:hypothetical protein [candidate division GN15 bacterium]
MLRPARLFLLAAALLLATAVNSTAESHHPAVFNDSGWTPVYQENFDTPFEAQDGQTFGGDDWLIFQLINGGRITVANGYAQLNAPDFWNAALIRSTDILPPEYKIRTKIGYINYDLTNYEQADYDHPDFEDHNGYYENGMYFLTVTNDTCVGNECAEYWWHYHRKMVIDVDNHLNYGGGGETFHPIYMVYMDPATNSGGNLLRTWDGNVWDSSAWNWNVAHTYNYDTWYYAELEKRDGHITLRLYDENKQIIEAPPSVAFEYVFAMDDPTEYLYVGEPHTDDYEGDVRIDEITLLVPEQSCCIGKTGNVNDDPDGNIDLPDVLFLVNSLFLGGPELPCPAAANVAGEDCGLDLADVIYLTDAIFLGGPELPACRPECEQGRRVTAQ